jgi:hypothetical protein
MAPKRKKQYYNLFCSSVSKYFLSDGHGTQSNTNVWSRNASFGYASKETELYVSIISVWIVWMIVTTYVIKVAYT